MIAEKDILVLKCNAFLKPKEMGALYSYVLNQMEAGVVLLPVYVDPVLVPAGTEIKISEFVPSNEKGERDG